MYIVISRIKNSSENYKLKVLKEAYNEELRIKPRKGTFSQFNLIELLVLNSLFLQQTLSLIQNKLLKNLVKFISIYYIKFI